MIEVLAHQRMRIGVQLRRDHFAHEARVGGIGFGVGAHAQRLGRESDVLVDVEHARLVLLEVFVRAPAEFGFLDPAESNDEFAPRMVRIERDQRVVEIEQAQVASHRPSSASICLTSGTVIARLVTSANSSSRSSSTIRCLRSRAKRVNR